jgi:hypothetical protein
MGVFAVLGPLSGIIVSLLAIVVVSRSLPQDDLEHVLQQVEKSRRQYIDTFRDLTAVETLTTEVMNKDAAVARQRTVISDFYVYPMRFRPDSVREYRITRQVDGKPAGNPTDEAMKLFRALAKAKTFQEEDEAILEQNFKHVLRFIHLGLAVGPLWALHPDQRQNFNFSIAGREQLGGREVVVLTYEPKTFRPPRSPVMVDSFKNPRTAFRGRVWLDANDWRIHRWLDDTIILDDDITTPAILMHKEIDYESGAIGVVPKRIAVATFAKNGNKKTPQRLRPVIRQTFSYEAFKRFNVATATEIGKVEF